jgi:FAD/FMN-containing dehydrogenase
VIEALHPPPPRAGAGGEQLPRAEAVVPGEPDEGHRRLETSFGERKLRRLVALKDDYDPHNTFSLNTNIPPSKG